jgi:hypothetical protein
VVGDEHRSYQLLGLSDEKVYKLVDKLEDRFVSTDTEAAQGVKPGRV